MKLDVAVNEVTLSGAGATGEFRIRNSAKAFKILSDGLYSNKIRAIIRELSCNAIDSHVAAGKENVQFEVHLPTVLEPYFAVKDFGLGLSGDQVTNIYTTYFESTKTDSNAFIGALGLGSKSPFSYTENFTITAIKDGMKRIYSAFINEAGVPCVAEMSTELTDEGNGVEVKFSVTERYDYDSFRHEAAEVFKWFKTAPKITGSTNFHMQPVTYKEKDIVPGVHTMDGINEYYGSPSIALMGNIAYPLNKIPEPKKHFGELASLLECGLVLQFEIGELDFAASREELSYIPLTLASIKKKLSALNDNLAAHLAEKADAIENEWLRASYLRDQSQSRLYRSAVPTYVANTKFKLYNASNHYGRFEFEFTEEELKQQGLEITAFRASGGSTSKYSVMHQSYAKNTSNLVTTATIPVEKDAIFVLNDLKTGCQARARYHYNLKRTSATVYCVSCTEDLEKRQAQYDWFMKKLHTPPVIVKASDLEKPVKKKPTSTQGLMYLRLKNDRRSGYEDSYAWTPYSEELDENTNYYYVSLSNYQPLSKDGTAQFNVQRLRAWMDDCGVPAIQNIKIIGVRQNRLKEIEEMDNWIWIEDKIKEEIAKVKDAQIVQMVSAEMLDSYNDRIYSSDAVAKAVDPNSTYAKYISKYSKISKTGNVNAFVQLCAQYGRSVEVDKVKKEITEAKKKVLDLYPLLRHVHNAKDMDVIHYIKLVDTQQEKN